MADAKGPVLENSIRAKWLSQLCPDDLEIGFAPNKGQHPLYKEDKIKIISKYEPGWWNHYFMNSHQMKDVEQNYSIGPNIYPNEPPAKPIPTVVYSEYHKKLLLNKWGDYPEKYISIIPNIIDNELYHVGEKSNQLTVGWIGRDSPDPSTKGMEVIPYLAGRFPDIQFVMVHGNKPAFQHLWLEKELPNLTIYSQVPHDELAKMMRSWSVLVCGSKWETGATHVKEAMASGVPIIAAKVGAIPEVAGSQMLLNEMKWTKSEKDPKMLVWTKESLEKFALALDALLNDSSNYDMLVEAALKESEKAFPKPIAKLWFDFMYKCRELNV
ncbi:glycosyltransferase family 4 protein [Saliterribacillus persicus]|nr:glycosyltransferase [Saliterribacillus persicus]